MKKVISVLLSVIMLASCFSVMAFATVNDAVLKITIKPTAEKYAKGDVVTFEVLYEATDDLGLMGSVATFSVGYDSSVFEPIEDVSSLPNYDNSSSVIIAGYPVEDNIVTSLSYVEVRDASHLNANDTAKGWDKVFYTSMTPDMSNQNDDDYHTEAASFAFQLKIKDDASDTGSYVIGITDYSVQTDETMVDEELGALYGPSGPDFGFACNNIFETVDATVVIGGAPQVSYYKAQLKMTPNSATTVADDFQFRVQSVITDADWDAYFAQTATADETKNAITEMGIVAYKGAGTFDEATAKALVTDGTAATDYATAGTTYVQKASDSADAYFGAIIKAKHSTMPNDVTYMGYVKYVDDAGNAQVIFYETAKTAALASNYDNYVSAYLAANPYSGS